MIVFHQEQRSILLQLYKEDQVDQQVEHREPAKKRSKPEIERRESARIKDLPKINYYEGIK